jgi:hypothetical protein
MEIDLGNGAYAATTLELPPVADPDWRILAIADFNDDGRADILWRHTSAAYVQYLEDRAPQPEADQILVREVDSRLRFVGVGDFDANGAPDILWRDQVRGGLACHLMHPKSRALGAVTVPLEEMDLAWKVAKLADLDSDGRTDILLRHESSDAAVVYFMNGDRVSGQTTLSTPRGPDFEIIGPMSELAVSPAR